MKNIALLFFLFLTFNLKAQKVIYVNDNATGINDGTSWPDAYTDLSTAMISASSGDSIFVAKGIYQSPAGLSFGLKKGVKLYGSFSGWEANLTQRDLSRKDTSVLKSDTIVISSYGATAETVLDGFKIAAEEDMGMENHNSSPTISHCTFSGNNSETRGGGIYNEQSSPTIINCTISGNTAVFEGGGISNYYSSPTIVNCIISGNSSIRGGGAIYNNHSSPTIINCIISGNFTSGYGGGIYDYNSSSSTLINCTLSGNSSINGGSIYIEGSTPNITNCIIYGNKTGIRNNAGGAFTTYSLVQDLPGDDFLGNIDGHTDPLFINAPSYSTAPFTTGNYHIRPGPAINSGDNSSIPADITTDIDGNARIYDKDNGGVTDLGAYERPGNGPSLAINSDSIIYTENTNPVAVNSGIMANTYYTKLFSAAVRFSNGYHADEDTLIFINHDVISFSNITASFNDTTGELTLTSDGIVATVTQWQNALRAITYANSSDDPSTDNRSVDFKVTGEDGESNTVRTTVTVAAVNDMPALTAGSGSPAFTEGDNEPSDRVVIDRGIVVSDADNDTLSSAAVSITNNFANGEDTLVFINAGSTMGDITASYDKVAGKLSLTSTAGASMAEWQAALRAVTYVNNSENPNESGRTISFTINDGTDNSEAVTKTITVTAVDDAPVITSNGGGAADSINVAENVTAVMTVTATDADAGTTFAYSLTGGADQDKFSIDGSTGALTFITAPDFESPADNDENNEYEITVRVSDGTKTDDQSIMVTVTDVNDVTPVIAASQSFAVNENSADGTAAGAVLATDGDVMSTTYQDWAIVSGNTNDAFKIDEATGKITVNKSTALDYEAAKSYTLVLTVSDGMHTSAPQTVTIRLNDQPEAPANISLTPVALYENTPAGTPVGKLSATTDDPGPTFTYTLVPGTGDADNRLFTINGDKLTTTSSLNYEQQKSYSIRVRAAMPPDLLLEKTFTVDLNNVNEPPTMDAIAAQTICFTTAQQEITLSGVSPGEDAGQTTGLSVNSDNAALFESLTVSGNKLQYRIKEGGEAGTAVITVTVTDNGGTANGGENSFSRSFPLTINPLPVPAITSDMGTELSKGLTAHLTATGGNAYEWMAADGILSGLQSAVLTVRPVQNTTYRVTVMNDMGCSAGGEIAIGVKADYQALRTTNIFTPNGDGKNDVWKIPNLDVYSNNEVFIYDRAGRLIFHKKNYSNDWNGLVNGHSLLRGTYYYIVNIESGKKIFKGFITVL